MMGPVKAALEGAVRCLAVWAGSAMRFDRPVKMTAARAVKMKTSHRIKRRRSRKLHGVAALRVG